LIVPAKFVRTWDELNLNAPALETYMNDFLVQALPIMVDSWTEILNLLRALAKLFGW
jgi:hypothetical protein